MANITSGWWFETTKMQMLAARSGFALALQIVVIHFAPNAVMTTKVILQERCRRGVVVVAAAVDKNTEVERNFNKRAAHHCIVVIVIVFIVDTGTPLAPTNAALLRFFCFDCIRALALLPMLSSCCGWFAIAIPMLRTKTGTNSTPAAAALIV